jgi:predicted nucleic-acid-binding Zn-ribbon protein
MDETKTVSLECIFCHSTNFELPSEDYIPNEDEHIKCANCGKTNIYADIKAVAIEKSKEEIYHKVKMLKKNLKNINIKLS